MTIKLFAVFKGAIEDDIYIDRVSSLGAEPEILAMFPTREEAVAFVLTLNSRRAS